MKYDDASWHNGGEFPPNSPSEYGGTHIALFMKWCFCQGWAGEIHMKEWPEDVQRVISGEMKATDFLFMNCDGKLTDEDLSDEGIKFANNYYGGQGLFLSDYGGLFFDEMYLEPEEKHNYSEFSSMVAKRYNGGVSQQVKNP